MKDTYIRYRVGLLGDWEHCEYFEKYKDALARYNELAPMFDNVHLVEMIITERIIDEYLDPLTKE
jgi:hypothetical protein